jgi:hypothetical protein
VKENRFIKILLCLFLLLWCKTYAQEHCLNANKYLQIFPTKYGKKSTEINTPVRLCRNGNTFVFHMALKTLSYTYTKHSLLNSKAMPGYMEDHYDCGEDYISIIHAAPATVKIMHRSASDHEEYGFMFSTNDAPLVKTKGAKK